MKQYYFISLLCLACLGSLPNVIAAPPDDSSTLQTKAALCDRLLREAGIASQHHDQFYTAAQPVAVGIQSLPEAPIQDALRVLDNFLNYTLPRPAHRTNEQDQRAGTLLEGFRENLNQLYWAIESGDYAAERQARQALDKTIADVRLVPAHVWRRSKVLEEVEQLSYRVKVRAMKARLEPYRRQHIYPDGAAPKERADFLLEHYQPGNVAMEVTVADALLQRQDAHLSVVATNLILTRGLYSREAAWILLNELSLRLPESKQVRSKILLVFEHSRFSLLPHDFLELLIDEIPTVDPYFRDGLINIFAVKVSESGAIRGIADGWTKEVRASVVSFFFDQTRAAKDRDTRVASIKAVVVLDASGDFKKNLTQVLVENLTSQDPVGFKNAVAMLGALGKNSKDQRLISAIEDAWNRPGNLLGDGSDAVAVRAVRARVLAALKQIDPGYPAEKLGLFPKHIDEIDRQTLATHRRELALNTILGTSDPKTEEGELKLITALTNIRASRIALAELQKRPALFTESIAALSTILTHAEAWSLAESILRSLDPSKLSTPEYMTLALNALEQKSFVVSALNVKDKASFLEILGIVKTLAKDRSNAQLLERVFRQIDLTQDLITEAQNEIFRLSQSKEGALVKDLLTQEIKNKGLTMPEGREVAIEQLGEFRTSLGELNLIPVGTRVRISEDVVFERVERIGPDGKSWGEAWRDPSGLIWSGRLGTEKHNHNQATELATSAGGRLPTKKEFEQLKSHFELDSNGHFTDRGRAAFHQLFPDMKDQWFWSSSVHRFNSYYACVFDGDDGYVYNDYRNYCYSVRCVGR